MSSMFQPMEDDQEQQQADNDKSTPLSISNELYPKWIRANANVFVEHLRNSPCKQCEDRNLQLFNKKIVKIAHYRHNKSISLYNPLKEFKSSLFTIKQSEIMHIDPINCRVDLHCGLTISPPPGLPTSLEQFRKDRHHFISEMRSLISHDVLLLVYAFTQNAGLKMYHVKNIMMGPMGSRIWNYNPSKVFGVEFSLMNDMKLRRIEIDANFGKVKTHVLLHKSGYNKAGMDTHKGVLDKTFDCPVARFVFKQDICLERATRYKIAIFISGDGASVQQCVPYESKRSRQMVRKMNGFAYMQWKLMTLSDSRLTNVCDYGRAIGRNDWHPLVRLVE